MCILEDDHGRGGRLSATNAIATQNLMISARFELNGVSRLTVSLLRAWA